MYVIEWSGMYLDNAETNNWTYWIIKALVFVTLDEAEDALDVVKKQNPARSHPWINILPIDPKYLHKNKLLNNKCPLAVMSRIVE